MGAVLRGGDCGGGELAHQWESEAESGAACFVVESDTLVSDEERELVIVEACCQRHLAGGVGVRVAHYVAACLRDRERDDLSRLIREVGVLAGKGGHCGA